MSASPHTESSQDGAPDDDVIATSQGDGEPIDALPVPSDGSTIVHAYPLAGELDRSESLTPAMIPTVQAAAVAAGGFVAGAAVVGLVGRRHRRSAALAKSRQPKRGLRRRRGRGSSSPAGELVQIVGSRSLLVDVHLLGGRD